MGHIAYLKESRSYLKKSTSGWCQVLPRSPFRTALLLPAAGSVGCSLSQNCSKLKREGFLAYHFPEAVGWQSFLVLRWAKGEELSQPQSLLWGHRRLMKWLHHNLTLVSIQSYFIHSPTGIVSDKDPACTSQMQNSVRVCFPGNLICKGYQDWYYEAETKMSFWRWMTGNVYTPSLR